MQTRMEICGLPVLWPMASPRRYKKGGIIISGLSQISGQRCIQRRQMMDGLASYTGGQFVLSSNESSTSRSPKIARCTDDFLDFAVLTRNDALNV